MNRTTLTIPAILTTLALASSVGPPAGAQISVTGLSSYNAMRPDEVFPTEPDTTDISNGGDLYLYDAELFGQLYLSGTLFMNSNVSFDGDQFIYFQNSGQMSAERIYWDDSENDFALSDDISLTGSTARIDAIDNSLMLQAWNTALSFVVDADDDNGPGGTHQFRWFFNGVFDESRAMQLKHLNDEYGNLYLAGTLIENHAFDLAESFWASEVVESGDLVAIDPTNPIAVVKARGAYDPHLIGVVSTRPGVLLGGNAFSAKELRKTWGDAIADEFESVRERYVIEAYAASPEFVEEAQRLASPASFAAYLEAKQLARWDPPQGTEEAPVLLPPSVGASELEEAYRSALVDHEMTLFDEAIHRFFQERFASVALAGRVPVKVDTSNGPIEVGDLLAAGPTAGVAMKATEAGAVIGTALEPWSYGSGEILVLAGRSVSPGLAAPGAVAAALPSDELTDLRRELAELRGMVRRLAAERGGARTAGLRGLD